MPRDAQSPFPAGERHCILALLLLLPGPPLTLTRMCRFLCGSPAEASADLCHLIGNIMRFHSLHVSFHPRQGYRLHGQEYAWRLCLLHWLQLCLRRYPARAETLVYPALQGTFSRGEFTQRLHSVTAILASYPPHSPVSFTARQQRSIALMLLFAARRRPPVEGNPLLPCWLQPCHLRGLQQKPEYTIAEQLCRYGLDNPAPTAYEQERLFTTLVLTLLQNHRHIPQENHHDRVLMHEIERCIAWVEHECGVRLPQKEQLCCRLFAHLGAAIERAQFEIRIGSPLAAEMTIRHPALLALTRRSLVSLERRYCIRFSLTELSLIAVSIGAWLMQAGWLQESST